MQRTAIANSHVVKIKRTALSPSKRLIGTVSPRSLALVLFCCIGFLLLIPTLLFKDTRPRNTMSATSTSHPVVRTRIKRTADTPPTTSNVIPRRPYSNYCSTEVLNELQLWNQRKKVISYALFEDGEYADTEKKTNFQPYMDGMRANVQEASLYYPDWVVRVHVTGLTRDLIDQIVSFDPERVEVVICHQNSPLALNTGTMMVTRFLVFDDPAVDVFISRDADSRFSVRELLAVNQFLSSRQTFHTMRDNLFHGMPIMGGMFGMKKGCLGSATLTGLLDGVLKQSGGVLRSNDQIFLGKHVWPLVQKTTIDHDNDKSRCERYGSAVCADWPIGSEQWSKAFFVGQPSRSKAGVSPGYSCSLNCTLRAA